MDLNYEEESLTLSCKAIAFCSSVIHARYMTEQFCNAGVACEYVTGETSGTERTALISRLVDEDDPLEVICSIDVFSEGIDISWIVVVSILEKTTIHGGFEGKTN